MKTKKYVLNPGVIDYFGTTVYITAEQLARYHRVSLKECIVIDPWKPETYKRPDIYKLKHFFPEDNVKYS